MSKHRRTVEQMTKHFCTITHGGKIISYGWNKPDLFKFQGLHYMRHAECDAILNLPRKYLRGKSKRLKLKVYRIDLSESKPCSQCIAFLRAIGYGIGIDHIQYSSNGTFHRDRVATIHNDHISTYWRARSHHLTR